MSELHYRYIKLVNGESIICTTDDDCANLKTKDSIYVCDPVTVSHMRIPRGGMVIESYVLTPWVSFIEDTVLEISTNQIIFAANINDNAKENYIDFVDKRNNSTMEKELEKTRESELSDTTLKLLDLLQLSNKDEEENENDGSFQIPGNRTIH